MEKIVLIAVDMDGTTFRKDKTISPIDYKAIKKAIANGIMIVPASGRDLRSMPSEIMDLPIKYFIAKNGSSVYDLTTNNIVYHQTIDNDLVYRFAKALQKVDHIIVTESLDQRCYGGTNGESVLDSLPYRFVTKDALDDNYLEKIQNPNFHIDKIGIRTKNMEDCKKILDLQGEFIGLNIMDCGEGAIEVNSRMASKGIALKWVVNKLGISKDNVAAIGDSDNDLIMLCYAGYSFAMGNGSRFARETANEITLSNEENGVAFAIDKILNRNQQ